MYFKGCPKCHGDLYVGEDIHGRYVSCIQCGYLRDLDSVGGQGHSGETFVVDPSKTARKAGKKVAQAA